MSETLKIGDTVFIRSRSGKLIPMVVERSDEPAASHYKPGYIFEREDLVLVSK